MNELAQHTPGPYFVFDHYCGRDPEVAGEEYARMRLIGTGQFDTIAEVRHGHDDIPGDVDANAALFAASFELLEALTIAMEWIKGWDVGFLFDDEWPADEAKINAAIAKAHALAPAMPV